jgi:hypothetical protein
MRAWIKPIAMLAVTSGLALAMSLGAPSAAPAVPSNCAFHKTADVLTGSCGPLFDSNPTFELKPAAAATSGVWRSDLKPSAVWTGAMTLESYKFPVTLEVYGGGHGLLRTEMGWFSVSDLAQSSDVTFTLDASQEVKPEALDRKIVERAAQILSSDAVWNRKDNRKCPDGATTWSLYCAMQKAVIEVTGAADHRRPAMEAVRVVIEDRSAGRSYEHRLMDYNNDSTTTLADVQSAFKEALAGMDDSKWLAKHGFATTSPF